MKYSCLIFSEGGKDKKFLMALIPLLEEYHAKKWAFNYDNASGSSPKIILEQCQRAPFIDSYVLVMCFIDQDKLKSDYPKTWEKEKIRLEKEYSNFTIMWQIDNAEEEYRRVLGDSPSSKHKINKIARKNVTKFKNLDFWNRILKRIKDKEQELEK